MIKPLLPNSVLPSKVYVVLDANGHLLSEQTAGTSHEALKAVRARLDEALSKHARTAILKSEWEKQEKLQSKWMKCSNR